MKKQNTMAKKEMTKKEFLNLVKKEYLTEENIEEWREQIISGTQDVIAKRGIAYTKGIICCDDDEVLVIGNPMYGDPKEWEDSGYAIRLKFSSQDGSYDVCYYSERGSIECYYNKIVSKKI